MLLIVGRVYVVGQCRSTMQEERSKEHLSTERARGLEGTSEKAAVMPSPMRRAFDNRKAPDNSKGLATNDFVRPGASHLLLIRVWQDGSEIDKREWRGRVQHMLTGEAHEFNDWASLVYSINEIIEEPDLSGKPDTTADTDPSRGAN